MSSDSSHGLDLPFPDREKSQALFILVGVTAAATALRFWNLGEWSFWSDEIATLRDSRNLHNVIGYPVGYALIGLVVRALGTNEFAARLVPAIVGILSVPVLYFIGARLFSRRAGLLAAGFLAVCSYHIYFSQFARYYTLLMLLGLLGMWAAFLGIERNRRKWLAAAVLLLGLSFWTHWSAALLLPALVACALWSARGERPRGLNWLNLAILFGPFLIGGIVLGPSVLGFLRQWGKGEGFSLWRSAWTAMKLADRLEPAALLSAAVAAWVLVREKDPRGKWLLPFAVLPPALAAVFVGFSEGGSRFGIVALPAVLLLAGAGLDCLIVAAEAGGRTLAWALVALVVASLGAKDVLYFTVEQGQRPRWREAVAYVMARQKDAAFIATAPQIFEHYSGKSALSLNDLDDGALARELSSPAGRETWVVIENVANVAPTDSKRDVITAHARRMATFPLRVRVLDYSVSVYRSGPEPPKMAPAR